MQVNLTLGCSSAFGYLDAFWTGSGKQSFSNELVKPYGFTLISNELSTFEVPGEAVTFMPHTREADLSLTAVATLVGILNGCSDFRSLSLLLIDTFPSFQTI